jgi:hypothetical protein
MKRIERKEQQAKLAALCLPLYTFGVERNEKGSVRSKLCTVDGESTDGVLCLSEHFAPQ